MHEPTQPENAAPADTDAVPAQTIVIQQAETGQPKRRWIRKLLLIALMISVMFNLGLLAKYQEYFSNVNPPLERFHSGDSNSDAKIAIIKITGTIMPPFTERTLRMIKQAKKDDKVEGVLLVIDSPGGLVADSHQIYHRLQELRKEKPVYVAMKRIAASGGIYVAMGAGESGKIFAEPTTWTGSIGVIIPRYDVSTLAEKVGVSSDSLKTGPFKDSLNPFRALNDDERTLWSGILDDAFQRFLNVIADNRKKLNYEQVKTELATGQIFTATEALNNGLVDEIGYEEDAIEALQKDLKLESVRVVSYMFQPSLVELLTSSVQAKQPENELRMLLDATVPKAMYLCSWGPGLPFVDRLIPSAQ